MVNKIYLMSGLSIFCFPLAYIYILFLNIRDFIEKKCKIENRKIFNRMIILCSFMIVILFSRYKFIAVKYSALYMLGLSTYLYFDRYEFSIKIDELISFIIKSTVIVAIVGIIMYVFPVISMPLKWVDLTHYNIQNRMFSTFFNPNIYGYYLSLIMILIAAIHNSYKGKKKIYHVLVFVLCSLCLYFTYSRTSWFTIVFVLIVASIICRRQYFLYAVISILIIFIAEMIFKTNRANVHAVVTDSSFQYRLELWRISFEIIKDNLFIGIGPGTFYKYTASYSDIVVKYIEHCHNVYLQVLMSMGLIPISSVLALYVKKWISGLKKLWKNRRESFSSFILILILFSMISSIFDAVLITPQIFIITILIVVLVKKVQII